MRPGVRITAAMCPTRFGPSSNWGRTKNLFAQNKVETRRNLKFCGLFWPALLLGRSSQRLKHEEEHFPLSHGEMWILGFHLADGWSLPFAIPTTTPLGLEVPQVSLTNPVMKIPTERKCT